MKKRMVLFLMGFALTATAFVSTPVAAGEVPSRSVEMT